MLLHIKSINIIYKSLIKTVYELKKTGKIIAERNFPKF